jgi:hypothetical protein
MLPGIWMSVNINARSDLLSTIATGFVSTHSLGRRKTGVLHHIDPAHAQQHLVFDDEHDCG